MLSASRLAFLACLSLALAALSAARAEEPVSVAPRAAASERDRALEAFFEREVRPLLAARCFECHGPDVDLPRSGLALRGAGDLLRGGHRGPAVVPGDPDASLLMRAVRREGELAMPPDDPLSASEVAVLERWVALGAPWPEGADRSHLPNEDALDHWAWKPPRRPELPAVAREELVLEPLDAFVLARLEAAGVEPNPPASDRQLVRRVHYDLLGLPPTHAEVERYVADTSPDKWAELIDRLLERPEYGERWGRRWLDVVRYAQTNGYERDIEKPYAFGYRDYVIRAFQEDKPYDRFLIEQLAGDELEPVTRDSLAATGFYRLGSWDTEPDDRLQAEFDALDDVLNTIGEGMLGVTLSCARCHDHLSDPIGQDDYYRMLGFVRNVQRWTRPQFALDSVLLHAWEPSEEDLERWEVQRQESIEAALEERQERIAKLRARLLEKMLEELEEATEPEADEQASRADLPRAEPVAFREDDAAAAPALELSDEEVIESLDVDQRIRLYLFELRALQMETSFEGELDWLLIVTERPEPEPTHVLVRGMARSPLVEVAPGFPPVLCAEGVDPEPELPEPAEGASTLGRRRVLAEWIASPEHPTTARVMANRVWQGHFGRGIVATPNDLGVLGAPPTHPELLDWLACELVDSGWSLKALHRRVLRSYTYRMSSSAANEAARELDPANELLWRQEIRRLDAEALHDSLLAVSGDLNPEPGGRGFFPLLDREVLAGASKPGEGWELSPPDERRRRAVYAFIKRNMLPPLLETFDLASPNSPIGTRPVTTTATQALALLNDGFVDARVRSLARRVADATEGGDARARVRELWRRVLGREPSSQELNLALEHLERQERAAAELTPTLMFSPKVPRRLQVDFLESLPGDAFLHAPAGWDVAPGRWGNEYNDTREADPAVGPTAWLAEPSFRDGRVRASVVLHADCEAAGFLLRGGVDEGEPTGIEVVLDPVLEEVRVVWLRGPYREPRVLDSHPASFVLERPFELVIELREDYLVARMDGDPLIELHEVPYQAPGHIGLRASGGAVELGGLSLLTRQEQHEVLPEPIDAGRLALESLCLVALNLNEFLYVD